MSDEVSTPLDQQDAPLDQLGERDDRSTALATVILGGLLLVFGIATVTQATRLSNNGNAVGPATAPWVVGVLLLLVGVLMVLRGRSAYQEVGSALPTHQTEVQDWKRLGVIVVALLVFAIVNPYLGYTVSATLLFGATAIVLGSPDKAKSFAYGFIVASLIFLLFDLVIGISLPAAVWGF